MSATKSKRWEIELDGHRPAEDGGEIRVFLVRNAGGDIVAHGMDEADARLLAAAPALLLALDDMMGWFNCAAVRNLMTKQGFQSVHSEIVNEANAAMQLVGEQ